MSEMEARVSRARRVGRQAIAGVAVLAVAGIGVAWSGCGGDDEDEVNQAVDEIQQEAEEAAEDVGGEAEELQQQAEEEIDEAQKQLEDSAP